MAPDIEPLQTSAPILSEKDAESNSVSTKSERIPIPQAWQFALIMLSLLLGTFLMALDETIISTAIPSVTSEFHSLDDIAWYSAGYILSLTALQPIFGKMYRLVNAKWVYLSCVVVFEVGSIICAAASSSPMFIVGRVVAGCGGAGLLQGALAIITMAVPLAKRPLYQSVILSAFVICVCVGPVIGGAFTEHVTWRWCFWINVPIGGLVFFLILIFLRMRTSSAQKEFRVMKPIQKFRELDLVGTTLIIGFTVSLLLALQWGGISRPWKSSTVTGLLVGATLMAVVFCWTQWRLGMKATIPLPVLKQRSILAGSLFLFLYAMPNYILSYYIPIYFQSAKGTTPITSAVNFLAIGIPQVASVAIGGALATTFGFYVPYMIAGSIISAIGAGFITTIDIDTPTVKWAVNFVFYAIGTGFAINVPYTAVQTVLREDDVPTANAILQFFFQLGAAIGLAASQTIFLAELQDNVRAALPSISPADVIRAGAYHLDSLTDSPPTLRTLRVTYSESLARLFILPLVAICLAVCCTFFVENKNIRMVAKEREEAENGDGEKSL